MKQIPDPLHRIKLVEQHLQIATERLEKAQSIPPQVRDVLASIIAAHSLLASCVKALTNTNDLPDTTNTLARQGKVLFHTIDWTYHKEAKDVQRCTELLGKLFNSHGATEFGAKDLRQARKEIGFFEGHRHSIHTTWVSDALIKSKLLERNNGKLRLTNAVLEAAKSPGDTPP